MTTKLFLTSEISKTKKLQKKSNTALTYIDMDRVSHLSIWDCRPLTDLHATSVFLETCFLYLRDNIIEIFTIKKSNNLNTMYLILF